MGNCFSRHGDEASASAKPDMEMVDGQLDGNPPARPARRTDTSEALGRDFGVLTADTRRLRVQNGSELCSEASVGPLNHRYCGAQPALPHPQRQLRVMNGSARSSEASQVTVLAANRAAAPQPASQRASQRGSRQSDYGDDNTGTVRRHPRRNQFNSSIQDSGDFTVRHLTPSELGLDGPRIQPAKPHGPVRRAQRRS